MPHATLSRCLATLAAGVLLCLCALLAVPELYLRASDGIRWRMGLPALGQPRLESTLQTVHLRGDGHVPEGALLLFGDSHLHSLTVANLSLAVNYAIAGETAHHLAERIGRYPSVRRARHIVVLTGRNDLAQGRQPSELVDAIARILRAVPPATGITLVDIPPTRRERDGAATRQANTLLAAACAARPGCVRGSLSELVDDRGLLDARFADADGIHLNVAGYQALSHLLLASAPAIKPPPPASGGKTQPSP